MMSLKPYFLGILSFSLCLLLGCGKGKTTQKERYQSTQTTPTQGDCVIISEPAEPDVLNPFMALSAYAQYTYPMLYQSLLGLNNNTLKQEPILAKTLPVISEDGMQYTFEIEPAATWDNGTPITGEDYVFSLKAILHPLCHTDVSRPYYSNIATVEIDPNNIKKFTVVLKEKYILTPYTIGDMPILPRYIFDPKNTLQKFSLKQIINEGEKLKKDPDFVAFAESFNNPQHLRDPKFIQGSGAYVLESWKTEQELTFTRKKTWWGDTYTAKNRFFLAYPQKIIFKVIPNNNAAITELKAGRIDALFSVPVKDFDELKTNERTKAEFNFHTTTQYAFLYMGLNTRPKSGQHPALADVKVRKAIAHLTDVDKMIKNVYYGYGQRIATMGLPNNKEEYFKEFNLIPYNVDIAKKLLEEAGWVDLNGDGIRDKMIDGKRVSLDLTLSIPTGNVNGRSLSLILQQDTKPAGVRISLLEQEPNVIIQNLRNHKFDLYISAWAQPPLPHDPFQLWHTSSWEQGGSNFVGFGDATTDKLIEEIRKELDPTRRRALNYQLQKTIYDTQPYVFLWQPRDRIAIHKRFQNQNIFDANPGFSAHEFWTPTEWVKYK